MLSLTHTNIRTHARTHTHTHNFDVHSVRTSGKVSEGYLESSSRWGLEMYPIALVEA